MNLTSTNLKQLPLIMNSANQQLMKMFDQKDDSKNKDFIHLA